MKDTQIRKIENFCKVKTWITQRDAYKLGIYRIVKTPDEVMHNVG